MKLFITILTLSSVVRLSNNQLIRDYQVYVGLITTLYKHYNAKNIFIVYGMDSSIGKNYLLLLFLKYNLMIEYD